MIYKFDILFKSKLHNGGQKVVSYSQLLKNPSVFGVGETLEDAVGTLSLTDNVEEKGYSLSALLLKYRSLLVGKYNADKYGKHFSLQFVFSDALDVHSLRAEICDENEFTYSFTNQTLNVDGTMRLDLTNADFIVALIPQDGDCEVSDAESKIELSLGQLALVPAAVKSVTFHGCTEVKSIKCI